MKLPPCCYAIHPLSGELIRVDWGQSGFMQMKDNVTGGRVTGEDAKNRAARMNSELGVTEAQVTAMLGASMFNVWGGEETAFGLLRHQIVIDPT